MEAPPGTGAPLLAVIQSPTYIRRGGLATGSPQGLSTTPTPTPHQTTILGTYNEKMHQEPMRGLVREKIHSIEAREN